MPLNVSFVPLDCAIQVAPPLIVRRIVPESPTAVPVLASAKDTLTSWELVLLDWTVQVTPSTVWRIVPATPTAVHVLALRQEMPLRPGDVGLD
jgi:hypothetical protein